MLARVVPGPLVRLFARPYVAGGSLEEAIDTAKRLLEERLVLSSLDLLGEEVTEPEQIVANERLYAQLMDQVCAEPRFARSGYRPWGSALPSLSLKPSAFTHGAPEAAREPIRRLAERAKRLGVALSLDMEDRRWTEPTIALAIDLFEAGFDVGAVLQTRLNRTEADVGRIPAGMRVRLVIGIYPESTDIAVTDKRVMKERMLACAERLLAAGAKVEFATHDEHYLERFLREVAPAAPDRCELQMLLGVPRETFLGRMRNLEFAIMLPVRLYVPFAVSWENATAYLRRRMRESPSLMWLVLRNLAPWKR